LELPFYILFFFEVLACVTGIFYYNKVKNTHWKLFSMYLVFIVLSELAGYYLSIHHQMAINLNFFNYFEIPVEFIFFFCMFYLTARKNSQRLLPFLCTVIYLVFWLIDIFYFSKKTHVFYSVSYTIGNLLLLILILRFFILLATSDEIITFRQNMLFWVSLGLLFFYLGSFPYYGLLNKFGPKYPELTYQYKFVVYGLNSLMYLMFTVSYICGKPNINSKMNQ